MSELGNTPADKNYKPSGISKAEERALKAYPEDISYSTVLERPFDYNGNWRRIFTQGYETAEKDLAPLIEAATIVYEAWNGGTMDDVRREMVELGKRIIEAKK